MVGEAASASAALAAAGTSPIDVVVFRADGDATAAADTARQLRSGLPRTPVLAVAEQPDERTVLALLSAGVTGFVVPSSTGSDEIASAVHAVADGGTYLCAGVIEKVLARYRRQAPPQEPIPLQPREREVLSLLADGLSSKQIAARLCISTRTVETHRRNIMHKVNLHSVAELTKYAVRHGLSPLER